MPDSDIPQDSDFLKIDEMRLAREWLRQPSLYFKYAKMAADKRSEMDEAKSNVDIVHAELSLKMRDDPEAYGIQKLTEAALSAAIPRRKEYKLAMKAWLSLKHDVEILTASLVALEHRKRAMTMLVEMRKMEYFAEAGARVPREMRDDEKPDPRDQRTVGKKKRFGEE